jgi:hypothetical protein
VLTLKDLPPAPGGQPTLTQPRFYYGEQSQEPFVIAGTSQELDYEGAPPAPYQGSGGIPVGNIFRRALFAWKFHDVNLLLSSQITSQSRLMIYRSTPTRTSRSSTASRSGSSTRTRRPTGTPTRSRSTRPRRRAARCAASSTTSATR